ncbi:conserved domain protein [Streptococcus parauberis NCFD 2020]|uniref:Conserved domain protein n=2 Tax=Streptococcus parauberis TaxID=1348 RepID=F1Z0S9_9STRE|nr:conserved domain protein [Streptococcus parauberis NCFD 2020]
MKPQNYEDFSIVLTKICLISLFIGAVGLLSTGTWVVD